MRLMFLFARVLLKVSFFIDTSKFLQRNRIMHDLGMQGTRRDRRMPGEELTHRYPLNAEGCRCILIPKM